MIGKVTRGSLVALVIGVAYLLVHRATFPLTALGNTDFFAAALVGALAASLLEWILHRRHRPPRTPKVK